MILSLYAKIFLYIVGILFISLFVKVKPTFELLPLRLTALPQFAFCAAVSARPEGNIFCNASSVTESAAAFNISLAVSLFSSGNVFNVFKIMSNSWLVNSPLFVIFFGLHCISRMILRRFFGLHFYL